MAEVKKKVVRKVAKKKVKIKRDKNGIDLRHKKILNKYYPGKTGFFRRIWFLFDTYYRVNLHNPYTDNSIDESYFVDVAKLAKIKKKKIVKKSG